jgi:hypothetical protein
LGGDAPCHARGQRQIDRSGPAGPPHDRNSGVPAIAAADDVPLRVDREGLAALRSGQFGHLAVAPDIRHILRGDERAADTDARGVDVSKHAVVPEHRYFGDFAAAQQQLLRPGAIQTARDGAIGDDRAVVAHAGDPRGVVARGDRQARHGARLLRCGTGPGGLVGRGTLDRDARHYGDGPNCDRARECPAGIDPSPSSDLHTHQVPVIK